MKHLAWIFILFLLVGCSSDELSKEQLLRLSIDEIETRFESRKLSDIVEYVDENYSDNSGRDIQDVKRAIQVQIMRHKSLFILSQIKNVEWLSDTQARVEITAAMTGKDVKDVSLLKSIRADLVNFNVTFNRQDDKFVVSSASWRHAYPSDFF